MSVTSNIKSFNYLDSGEVTYSTLSTVKTKKTLDSGCYTLTYLDYPQNRVQVTIDRDVETSKVHKFPQKEKLDKLFAKFFNKKLHKKMVDLGFGHKTGVLMHGKEGTGKTTIMKHYYSQAVEKNNAIVFFVNQNDYKLSHCWEFIVNIREVQNNPIIVVFDEFDQQFPKNEAYLKTVLDGNLSIDNCIFFASTNYLNNIPDAIKDRESRFKYSIKIEGIHSVENICSIMKNLIGDMFKDDEIKVFAESMKGCTLDKIKQFCIDKIMNLDSEKTTKKKIGF